MLSTFADVRIMTCVVASYGVVQYKESKTFRFFEVRTSVATSVVTVTVAFLFHWAELPPPEENRKTGLGHTE